MSISNVDTLHSGSVDWRITPEPTRPAAAMTIQATPSTVCSGTMHGHTTLMLAAVGVVAAFVPIVVLARWLEMTGRLGDPERRVPFRRYGPIVAGALSLGTAAVHLSIIGDHVTHSAAAGDPVLFLCSIGVASAAPIAVDAKVLGFLPIGVASLLVTPLQGIWGLPRSWRSHRAAIAGVVVAVAALGISATQLAMQPSIVGPTAVVSRIGEIGTLALVGEGLLLVAIAVLVSGRPRRLVAALEARAVDAFVATALAVVAVIIFTVVALLFGHVGH
jgi:hypothetical protein